MSEHRGLHGALILGAMLAAAIGAQAATSSSGTQGPRAELADDKTHHFAGTADHVRIATVDYVSGGEDRVIVVVVIDTGFHINSNPASFDYLIPTTLTMTNQTPVRVVYPEAVSFKPRFADQAINVYEGRIQIVAAFPKGTFLRERHLFGTLIAQACTDQICLPPATLPLPRN
jgi:hypothetical protein